PALRGPGWAAVDVAAAGVCGSDIAALFFKLSPSLSPFSSFPCVLGHEVFGHVAEVGAEARAARLREGDAGVVHPAVALGARRVRGGGRGGPACRACAGGRVGTCHRAGETGALAPGGCVGYHRDLPGGFCERLVAHHTQLVRVPAAVPDGRAVLTEPLAIG